jgi:tripartite-type tricarboxylate transporter receptor subunit TctC
LEEDAMRRRTLLLATLPGAAVAQAPPWPTRPLRIIVPFPAGNAPDTLARRLAEGLAPRLGQPVAVENRPGAGGTIGAEAVARAAPDGHTLGISNIAPYAVGPTIYPGLAYDPVRDFTHLALLAEIPLALAVSADAGWRDLAAFLAAARDRPGTLRVGTPGNGTSAQVSLELLRRMTGAEVLHVPFRGGQAAAVETIAGRIEAAMANLSEVAGNDRLRVLGMGAEARLARWPAVPSFAEQGVPLLATIWFGLCAPARLPETIAERLHRETAAILGQPGAATLLASLGSAPARGLSRPEVAAFVAAEGARWGEAARTAGVRPD